MFPISERSLVKVDVWQLRKSPSGVLELEPSEGSCVSISPYSLHPFLLHVHVNPGHKHKQTALALLAHQTTKLKHQY